MECDVRTPNLRLEPRMCVSLNVNQRENVTREGFLFTPSVGCSRLLSAVNDLTTKKILQNVTSEQLGEEAAQRVAPSYDAALSRAQRCLTYMNFMNSTRNRSTATKMCWKKTTDAISDTARKESMRVAFLQTHGKYGAIL